MDLLEQYKQDNPEAFREKPPEEISKEYGFFVRLAMKMSRGTIRDIKEANRVLVIAAIIIFLISLYFFIPLVVPLVYTPSPVAPVIRVVGPDGALGK